MGLEREVAREFGSKASACAAGSAQGVWQQSRLTVSELRSWGAKPIGAWMGAPVHMMGARKSVPWSTLRSFSFFRLPPEANTELCSTE